VPWYWLRSLHSLQCVLCKLQILLALERFESHSELAHFDHQIWPPLESLFGPFLTG